MNTKGMKLRYYVFFFYVITGLLPLLLLTYYYTNEYVNSFLNELKLNVNTSLKSISISIDERIENYKKSAFAIAQLSIIKASMTEYLSPLKKDYLKKRLKEFGEYFGFDSVILLRENGKKLLMVNDVKNKKVLDFKEPILSFDGKILGYLIAKVRLEKILKPFLIYSLDKSYRTKKEVWFKGENYYVERENIMEPEMFTFKLKNAPIVLKYYIDKFSFFKNYRNKIFTIVVLILSFVVLSIIFSIYFLNWITKPYKTLVESYEIVSKGNLDYRIKDTHVKEINFVYNQFNNMIEKLKKTQEKMIQFEKLSSLGLLSAGIAHEVKNPLASMKMILESMKINPSEYNEETLEILNNEIDRIGNLLNNLLDFAKPTPANKIETGIVKEINSCVSLLKHHITQKNIRLNISVKDTKLYLDRNHLQQILLNLILNAIQAIEGEGKIDIIGKKAKNLYILEIKDTGKGIKREILTKIFDPFFTTKHSGTGLGLSIVYSLCRENDIELEINSIENEGTKVMLIFKYREA